MECFQRGARRALFTLALLLAFGAGPAPAHAQSMQSIQDKLVQLQNSLNTIAAGITARLITMGGKLDQILSKLNASTDLATGPEELRTGETAVCRMINTGADLAGGKVSLFNGTQFLGSSSHDAAPTGIGGSVSFTAQQAGTVWCRLEPGAGGHQMRASLTITDAAGTKLVRSDAH
jgi:hypothetical protein